MGDFNNKSIDLSRHGVIEAHAGTGKTYTIVKMMMRILEQTVPNEKEPGKSRYIHIREVLLVTYTEKAAGELRRRIREGIEEKISELETAGTGSQELIRHLGECLNNMHEALIGTIHAVCLRLLQTWPFETGVHFQTRTVDDTEGLEGALRESIRTDWQNPEYPILESLAYLEERGEKLGDTPIDQILKTAKELLDSERAQLNRSGFSNAASAGTDINKNHREIALICEAAERLRDRWIKTKRANGQISFQDMLRLMHEAVYNTENPTFLYSLRKRLRFGIIDEFQDTSIMQWEIFKRLFLDDSNAGGPKLFIVGDPKQSIYSFMGADVASYLRAKESIVPDSGGIYALEKNYRSLSETIDGYNAILARKEGGEDWFGFHAGGPDSISYPSDDAPIASAPDRAALPEHPLQRVPVQIMRLEGKIQTRMRQMAKWTSMVIRELKKVPLSVPDGDCWKETPDLEYRDFAIIVEKHRLADCFLEQLEADGIAAVKYKMEGVFQSAMARDLHALLRSMVHREGDPAPRLAVLLTHFFNRQPETIEPDKDLEPCHSPGTCGNGASCIAHALQEWISLADRQRWAQLFRSVQERTGIRERLIALVDGERHLADLRQVIDYCIEKLCRGNFSLNQLVEHLKRLLDNEESVGQDENLHVLATDKSSVRVLTMHAAKGLEFKVVFVVNRAPTLRSPLVWIGEDQKKTVMPALSISQEARNSNSKLNAAYINVEKQKSQERRRLMYVALTRAQAMLFVPMHFGNKGKADDNDLTPRLQHLLAAGKNSNVKQFDPEEWRSTKPHNTADADDVDLCVRVEKIPDICNLKLPSRICRQTSYTQLSRYASGKQDTDPEYDDDDDPTEQAAPQETRQLPALPGGKQTGDALHLAIEELLGKEDINTLINDVAAFRALIEKHLENNGILRQIAKRKKPGKTKDDAVLAAVEFVRGALTTEISLPAGGGVKIVDLQKTDRIPEMEFMLGADPHWIHGFMDLVFRVPEKSAGHPWRYYVLDWKSDQAEKYELEHIEKAMSDRHYDLQARLYNHALDKYLKGILGDVYDPARNLGGAIYVFLRSFQRDLGAGQCHFVIRRADPVQDAQYTADRISDLIGKGSS